MPNSVHFLHSGCVSTRSVLTIVAPDIDSLTNAQERSPEQSVFRIGNSTDSRLDHVRRQDVTMAGSSVIPGNSGISLETVKRLLNRKSTGWVWIIFPNTPIPKGLKIIEDPRDPDHFLLGPAWTMEVKAFEDLLSSFKKKVLSSMWNKP